MARKPKLSLLDAIEALEPSFRKAFLDSVADVKSAAQMSVIIRALEENRIDDVINALNLKPEFFAPLDDAIRAAYLQGGRASLSALPALTEPGGGRLAIRFGGSNPRAQRWVQRHSSTLIVEIIRDQRDAVRTVVEAGIQAGRNPRSTALEIVGRINRATGLREGGILGLTEHQGDMVKNVRDTLSDPDLIRGYFVKDRKTGRMKPRFKLTDRRSDGIVRRAIAEGRAVSAKDAQSITTRYEQRLLKLRGDTIARTESLGAFNAGQQEGLNQLVDSGAVQSEQIRRVWRTAHDSRVRDTHQALEGETVGVNETFSNGLMFPAEPGGPPAEVINCRCVAETRIDFLTNL